MVIIVCLLVKRWQNGLNFLGTQARRSMSK
jgi:hypothetical protein